MASTGILAPGFSLSLSDQWIVFDTDADGDVEVAVAEARLAASRGGETLTPHVEQAMRRLFAGWASERDSLAFAGLFHATDPQLGVISAALTMTFSESARSAYDQWLEVGVEQLAIAEGRDVRSRIVPAADGRSAIRTFERRTAPLVDGVDQETGVWVFLLPATDQLALVLRCTSPALEFADALSEMFDEIVASLRFTPVPDPASS